VDDLLRAIARVGEEHRQVVTIELQRGVSHRRGPQLWSFFEIGQAVARAVHVTLADREGLDTQKTA
jgi:hypothetical protein